MTTAVCVHHFMVETPNGEQCKAKCKHCGETRTYWTAGPPDLNKAHAYSTPHYEPPTMARFL